MRGLISRLSLSPNVRRVLPVLTGLLMGATFAQFFIGQAKEMARLRTENGIYRQLFEAQAQGSLDIAQTTRVLDALKKEEHPFGPGTIVIVNGGRH